MITGNGQQMKNSDLIAKLNTPPKDLPIMFKVGQELTGYDNFAWMRGECTNVEVIDIYPSSEEHILDYQGMFDLVNDDPEDYGLSKDATDEDIEEYIDKHKKETVIAIDVWP